MAGSAEMATCPVHVAEVVTGSVLSVLDIGVKFTYTIPCFSSISVDLRSAKLQYEANNSVVMVDGFIKAEASLDCVSLPFSAEVNDFCFIPVSFLS